MSRKPNQSVRTKRVLLIVGVLAAIGLAFAGFRVYRKVQGDRDAEAARETGKAALESGDYEKALDGIGRYLQRFAEDGKASAADYVLYARARRQVEMPNGQHLADAMQFLRRGLKVDPGCKEAQKDLLDLCLATGFTVEALELVDTMCSVPNPDRDLLRTKYELHIVQNQRQKALDVARRMVAASPDDVFSHFLVLNALRTVETPPREIEAWVDGAVASHANNVRFELLQAALALSRNDKEKALRILSRVVDAATPKDDPEFVSLLLRQLDAAGRFEDALRVIDRMDESKDKGLRRELVRRHLFAGRGADIAKDLARWGGASAIDDPEIVAIEALGSLAAGNSAEAEAARAKLAALTDRPGKAWCAFVTLVTQTPKPSPSERVAALRDVVAAVPDSAILRHALGEAYADVGEGDLAVECWTAAAARAPSWSKPLRNLADAIRMTTGRENDAVDAARGAVERSPNDVGAILAYIRTVADCVDRLGIDQRKQLVKSMATVRQKSPRNADDILPLEIAVIATYDRAQAESRFQAIIESNPPPGSQALLRLAGVAAAGGFPFDARLLDVCESAHGVTPRLALARAVSTARRKGPTAGLEAMDSLHTGDVATQTASEWATMRATYLDWMGDPGAGKAWLDLADRELGDVERQLGALNCEAAWTDRERVAGVIERVRMLSGDTATSWRIARARWLLEAPAAEAKDIAEAAKILADVCRDAPKAISSRILFAQTLERLDNAAGAEEQLRLASAMAPDNSYVSLELARIYLQRGNSDGARAQIDRALRTTDVPASLATRAAQLLSMQGDYESGSALLERLVERRLAGRAGMMLLATLSAKLGRTERAGELFEKLLAQPDLEAVELAADFFRSNDRKADADRALASLDGLTLSAGEREMVRARHALSWGDTSMARDWFRKATDANPGSDEPWSQLVAYAVAAGDVETLAAVAADPRAATVPVVQFVRTEMETIAPALADVRLRPLVMAALPEGLDRPALLDVVRIVRRDGGDPGRKQMLADTINTIADAHGKILPLQVLAADLSEASGNLVRASEIARRSMSRFVNSAPAAWQAASLLAKRKQWDAALQAGNAWRDRTARQDAGADVFVSRVLLELDRPAEAADTLEPRLPAAIANRDLGRETVALYLVALVRSGRTSRLGQFLAEQIRRDESWRTYPLQLRIEGDLANAVQATAWLRTCGANVPAGDVAGRVGLAKAWARVWQNLRTPPFLAGAREVLAEFAASPQCPAEVSMILGTLAHQSGDLEEAKRRFSAALERDNALVDAHNNLAVILTDEGKWKEAVAHASVATTADPKDANYLDTLACALRRGREFDKAVATHAESIRLEPGSALWRLSLAETLAECGRVPEAVQEAAKAEELVAGADGAPPGFRKRMDRLRTRLR